MALTITDQVMRSPYTRHTATAWPVPGEPTLWTVTWLAGRNLTCEQAEAAMKLAETIGKLPIESTTDAYTEQIWERIDALAAELGLSGPDALARVTEPEGLPYPERAGEDPDCE